MIERKKLKNNLVYIRDKDIPCLYFVREKQGYFVKKKHCVSVGKVYLRV